MKCSYCVYLYILFRVEKCNRGKTLIIGKDSPLVDIKGTQL